MQTKYSLVQCKTGPVYCEDLIVTDSGTQGTVVAILPDGNLNVVPLETEGGTGLPFLIPASNVSVKQSLIGDILNLKTDAEYLCLLDRILKAFEEKEKQKKTRKKSGGSNLSLDVEGPEKLNMEL